MQRPTVPATLNPARTLSWMYRRTQGWYRGSWTTTTHSNAATRRTVQSEPVARGLLIWRLWSDLEALVQLVLPWCAGWPSVAGVRVPQVPEFWCTYARPSPDPTRPALPRVPACASVQAAAGVACSLLAASLAHFMLRSVARLALRCKLLAPASVLDALGCTGACTGACVHASAAGALGRLALALACTVSFCPVSFARLLPSATFYCRRFCSYLLLSASSTALLALLLCYSTSCYLLAATAGASGCALLRSILCGSNASYPQEALKPAWILGLRLVKN